MKVDFENRYIKLLGVTLVLTVSTCVNAEERIEPSLSVAPKQIAHVERSSAGEPEANVLAWEELLRVFEQLFQQGDAHLSGTSRSMRLGRNEFHAFSLSNQFCFKVQWNTLSQKFLIKNYSSSYHNLGFGVDWSVLEHLQNKSHQLLKFGDNCCKSEYYSSGLRSRAGPAFCV